MSEHEVELTSEERGRLVKVIDASYATRGHLPLRPVMKTVEQILNARLAASTQDIEAITKVLIEHEDATGWVEDADDNLLYECRCGQRSRPLATSGYGITESNVQQAAQWHRAHVAAIIAARLADAEARAEAAERRLEHINLDAQYDRCADRYLIDGQKFREALRGDQ